MMSKMTLQAFLANRSLLAIKIASADLSGFFRKAITIPLNTTGLALFADGASALFREGQEVSGKFDLVLAKHGEVPVRLAFPDLRSADGFPLAASLGISAEIATTRPDLFRDFCRSLFNFPGAFGVADLRNHLAPEARRLLSEYAAVRPAADLHRAAHGVPVGEILQPGLERFLFDAGVRYGKLLDLTLTSEEFERRATADQKRRDDDRRAVEVMDRKEERLRRLAAILKDRQVQDLLTQVPDEKLRGLLYAKLMEDDAVQITAEELVSKAKDCGEEVVQVIYKAMETLLSTGASVAADEIESSTADRIFLAAGSRVLEIDPAEAEQPLAHAFPEPLRSVRHARTSRGEFLLGGSKRAVSCLSLGGGGELAEYPLPDHRSVRGGVNSIALDGEHLYATHSEYGLARWRLDRPGGEPEFLFEELTRPHKSTRGVLLVEGRLVFASGHHVYAAAPGGRALLKYVSSVESPVTCVAAAARTVFAGTEGGSIVCWKLDSPDQPVVLARKREPIVNLRLARICAIPHLIYSTKDLSVRARVIGQNLETSYESGGATIGVLDASSDLICASDAAGRRLLLWKSTAPSRPVRQIEVYKQSDKPVLDIWMKKVRANSA